MDEAPTPGPPWVPALPATFASGVSAPALDEIGPRGVFVPGDFARFARLWKKLEGGESVRIAAIGGSITAGAGASSSDRCWGRLLCEGLGRAFPGANVDFVNAGIGATGSNIGAFRLKRDVLDRRPDAVVVEFAVNDSDTEACAETFEGIVRQLLLDPSGVAVAILGMCDSGGRNSQDREGEIARHYGVPFVSWRDALYPCVESGRIKWSDISPDVVHPNDAGHAYAAALLGSLLSHAHARWASSGHLDPPISPVPPPLFGTTFDSGEFLCMKDASIVANDGFFPLEDICWGEGLACTAPGGRLVFEVDGATCSLLYRLGNKPFDWGKIDVSVDGRKIACGLDCHGAQSWWKTPALPLFKNEAGRHRVEVVALSEKNAESDGFGCHLTGVLISGGRP